MSTKYQQLPADEKFHDVVVRGGSFPANGFITTMPEDEERITENTQSRSGPRWIWLIHAVLFTLSFTMFVASYYQTPSTKQFVKQFSTYSPAREAVQYQDLRFNLSMGTSSPYTGASPEVDDAWNAISYDMGDQMITREELDRLGMPESHLKVTHPVTGEEGWRVGLEVFHQLHCLNLIRQFTYSEYYEPLGGDIGKGEHAVRAHLDHCIEVLRMNVQCSADIGVFTLYMLPPDPLPWPELNTHHTCRNFDKVREWAVENSVGIMEKPMAATGPVMRRKN